MKTLEDIGKIVPFLAQYPAWVQAIFLLTLFLILASVFLAVVMHPKLHEKKPSETGATDQSQAMHELERIRNDLRKALAENYSEAELRALHAQLGFTPSEGTAAAPLEHTGAFLSHCIENNKLLPLLDTVLRKIDSQRQAADGSRTTLFRALHGDGGDFSASDFQVLDDGTINLAPKNSTTVAVTVVFKSTGERFRLLLPNDLLCAFAARRVVAHVFFRDIPFERRLEYLAPGADYFLMKDEERFGVKTLREAGITDGDEISVVTEVPYPWAHDVNMAGMLMAQHQEAFDQELNYRLFVYARTVVKARLGEQGLALYGPP